MHHQGSERGAIAQSCQQRNTLRKLDRFWFNLRIVYIMTGVPITPDGKITKILIKEGFGRKPNTGEKVCLIYSGKIKATGEVFDSSEKNGHKFKFELGKDEVIDGLTLSVATMQLGERAVFTIGYEYGYGEKGRDPVIPPAAVLEFDIELADIREKFFNAIDADKRAYVIKDQAAELFKEGKLEECIRLYRSAYHIVNDWVNEESMKLKVMLSRNLAICYGKTGQWKKSLKKAEYVLKTEPGDARALLRQGEALLELGRLSEARKSIQLGISVSKGAQPFRALQTRLAELEKPERERQNQMFAQMLKK